MRLKHSFVVSALILSGCNIYSPIDSPSGDAQALSKARACFDAGDYSCAATHYGKLSSAYDDEHHSEIAFLILDQQGATTAAFMNAIVNGADNMGKLITTLAVTLNTSEKGADKRFQIFQAYKNVDLIQNSKLRGLIRFATSFALLSEIFAEGANQTGPVKGADLVVDLPGCIIDPPTVLTLVNCAKNSLTHLLDNPVSGDGVSALATATDSQMQADDPDLFMILATAKELEASITELSASGDLKDSVPSFTQSLTDLSIPLGTAPGAAAFRKVLVQLNIGA